jgi:hypothetical protein
MTRSPRATMCCNSLPLAGKMARLSNIRGPGVAGRVARRQGFFQAFPNLSLFSPRISKESFGDFVGFQGVAKTQNRKSVLAKYFVFSLGSKPIARRQTRLDR